MCVRLHRIDHETIGRWRPVGPVRSREGASLQPGQVDRVELEALAGVNRQQVNAVDVRKFVRQAAQLALVGEEYHVADAGQSSRDR